MNWMNINPFGIFAKDGLLQFQIINFSFADALLKVYSIWFALA